MFKEIAEALARQDYQTAARLVNDFQTRENDNPWLKFYQARLNEITGEIALAGQEYRKMLLLTANPQLIAQIRQGIARLEAIEQVEVEQQQQQRQAALEKAKTNPSNREMGLLILEPVANAEKQPLALKFAQIFKIDAYNARLHIPSRSWRLYRVGAMAELAVYVHDLRKEGIPCFCQPIKAINRPRVYLARYFRAIQPEATLVYQSSHGLTASITFDWSEVTAVVEGILPIFGECVDRDARRHQVRKISILDYAQIIDLHLKKQDLIIRICDRHYHFQAGITFSDHQQSRERQTSNRDNWNHFASYLKQQLAAVPLWSDFPAFAETTADFYELLPMVNPHLDLLRIEDTYWDTAFQLYSTLIFLEKTPPTATL
ncbi:tetratricopeptide repeat protein [Microcystis aeruginosa]|uniref:Tetratricopeptide repeat protein n=1 Tax=Microcystis aeruginosa 11-30S32 TaxID=2358142 RepID=A0A510PD10_MICAE|nr:tetratricopeptide repeat protein [Microcystis aeruginosa]GCA91642.1 hypothetical protein MAE30S32_02940 [Microcystis aeruginosa 11-30S32]